MKLNLDCVRSILLCVEDNTGLRTRCIFVDSYRDSKLATMGMKTQKQMDYQKELLEEYDIDELMYHVKYCIEADLIAEVQGSSLYLRQIADLTPKGHNFLANIRDNSVWGGVKSVAAKIGSKSLDAVTQIASNVVAELIKSHFGIR